jgi:hypothetical protein
MKATFEKMSCVTSNMFAANAHSTRGFFHGNEAREIIVAIKLDGCINKIFGARTDLKFQTCNQYFIYGCHGALAT